MTGEEVLTYLAEVFDDIAGVRVYPDPAATVDPPGLVIGPPEFEYEGYQAAATGARLLVALVAAADDRALSVLYRLLPLVTAAVHEDAACVVRKATPSTWPAGGGSDLPAYLIEIEVAL